MTTNKENEFKLPVSAAAAAASKKQRNRVPISCTICRRRKVKCDKRRPICTACDKTGVAHLCHFIDPSWAQPLSSEELYTEPADDVEKLKERIHNLEAQLSKASGGSENGEDGVGENIDEEPLNEPLNLGKKFDMLHIKSTATTHLGATSWLAIMKGDPYLRVLWAHIFKVRKQVEEFKHKRKVQKRQITEATGLGTMAPSSMEQPTLAVPRGKCPVAPSTIIKSLSTCPVVHSGLPTEPRNCPVSGVAKGKGQCPVAHENADRGIKREFDDDDGEDLEPQTPPTLDGDRSDERVCPLMIGDNTFLMGNDQPDQHEKKRRKSARSNSNASTKSEPRKVTPEDFKSNPVEMMQKYLPTKKVLWLFIERFFEVLYVYMPYVDEKDFREQVQLIMGGPEDEEQVIKINIRQGVDFALVGTVCIILRLVWNTLPINSANKLLGKPVTTKSYQEAPAKLELMQKKENEIPLELIDCVKHCFSNLKLMRKSSLKIVQCSLYMKMYFSYSPEDGDGADGADSQIFLGMIIQMAISIGLHRDPKNFENFGDERQRHLWRKIWYALITLDVSQSVNLGCPRGLRSYEEFSDTILPTEDCLDHFENDLKELTVIKNVHMQAKLDKLLSRTMNVLLNVNTPARRSDVDALIKELQNSISGFGVLTDQSALPQMGKILINRSKNEPLYSSGTRAIQVRAHVTVNMMVYLLNYILYVHFEPRGSEDRQAASLAKNYAQTALDCALEGYRSSTLFFDCGLDYFGPGADIVLAPLLLLVGHRSMQFMVSLILRSRCGPLMKPTMMENNRAAPMESNLSNMSSSSENNHKNYDLDNVVIKDETEAYKSIFSVDVDSGERLASILLGHMDKFHNLSAKLGQMYPYSWRMSKAVGFFIVLLRKPTNMVKSMVKTENVEDVEQDTGEISNLLNSVPLVLGADEEQMKRCPVFSPSAEVSATRSTIAEAGTTRLLSRSSRQPHVPHFPVFSKGSTPQVASSPASVKPSFLTMFSDGKDMGIEMPDLSGVIPQPDLENDKSIGDMFDMIMSNTTTGPTGLEMGNDALLNFEGGDADPGMDFGSMMNGGWFQ